MLAQLPPPADGLARVYRGQTRDYPSLLPIGVRTRVANQRVWLVQTRRLVAKMLNIDLGDATRVDDAELAVLRIWVQAIVQHYGPGSGFLDVTRDVATAVWFALHKSSPVSAVAPVQSDRSVDPLGNHLARLEMVVYEPRQEPGFLYVLDVPVWNGDHKPAPGHLIDLALAPEPFCRSKRMIAQKGCLLYCRDGEEPVDMRNFVVPGTPIAIARPLSAPSGDYNMADLFPPPSVDEWYRRLLSMPLAYQATADGQILKRVVSVTGYVDPLSESFRNEIIRCSSIPQPPQIGALLSARWIADDEIDAGFSQQALANAIGLMLEAPLLSGLPGPHDVLWNHELLLSDLPEEAPAWGPRGEALGMERIDNVVVEFSPLDADAVTVTQQGGRGQEETIRAVWIQRRDGRIVIGLFYRQGSRLALVGPLELRFDHEARQLSLHVFGERQTIGSRQDSSDVGLPVMASLHVLRHLSRSAVVSALALYQVSVADRKGIVVSTSHAAACLVRGSPPDSSRRWYFVRDSENRDDFFTTPSSPASGLIETTRAFADLDANVLRAQVDRQYRDQPRGGHAGVDSKTQVARTTSIDPRGEVERMTSMPPERTWVSGIFRQMLSETTSDGRRDFVFRHPVLLSGDALDMLASDFPAEPQTLAALEQWRLHLWDHPEEYPHGYGPLDELIDALRKRELTFDQARARAIEPARAALLSNTYIRAAMEPVVAEIKQASTLDGPAGGDPVAIQAAELMLDSAFAMPYEHLSLHVRLGAAFEFIDAAHATLMQTPDGRLLQRANDAGTSVLTRVDSSVNPAARGRLLHELGVMELDAYASPRWPATPDYAERIAPWLARATNAMPEPSVALARARLRLMEAVELRESGSERGATLKALLQATIYEARAQRSEPKRDDLRSLAQLALQHLDPDVDSAACQWVRSVIFVLRLE